MNIFILDDSRDVTTNVYYCAKYHTDKHVVSQAKETGQLICNAILKANPDTKLAISIAAAGITLPCGALGEAHQKHPCAKWLFVEGTSDVVELSKLYYLAALGSALCEEKEKRWPLNPEHSYKRFFDKLSEYLFSSYAFHWTPEQFPIAVNGDVFHGKTLPLKAACDVYRGYYIRDKQSQARWKIRGVPYWYTLQSESEPV